MRAKTGALIAVGVAILAFVRYLLGKPRAGDDRPAMIIKNGSITFENEGKTVGWDDDSDTYFPDQPNGKKVAYLVAEAKHADKGCERMEGNKLVVTYTFDTGTQDFEVKVTGKKPKIKPRNKLHHDTRTKELRFGNTGHGRISKVELGGKTCTFSTANGEITVWYVYDE